LQIRKVLLNHKAPLPVPELLDVKRKETLDVKQKEMLVTHSRIT
jgi:hypothetical protein